NKVYLNDINAHLILKEQPTNISSKEACEEEGFKWVEEEGVCYSPGSIEEDFTYSLVVEDLNLDGYSDYIAGNYMGQNKIYFGDGQGNFRLVQTLSSIDKTHSIAVADADLNGDGFPDFIVGNEGRNIIYLNNGLGKFYSYEESKEEDNTYSVAIGDLNGDGYQDYIAGNYGGESQPYYNLGEKECIKAMSKGFFWDSSKKTCYLRAGNRIYLNDGKGSFTLFVTGKEKDKTTAIAISDFNGDDYLDYVAGNYNDPNRVYLNDGKGNFTLSWLSKEKDKTLSIAVGDLNGDDYMDFIVGYDGLNRVYVNNGSGEFELLFSDFKKDKTYSIAIADFDNNGSLDYVAGNDGYNKIYINTGDGYFEFYARSAEVSKTRSVAVAELLVYGETEELCVYERKVITGKKDGEFY
ncbi:MAG: VCBS repeat-containing protein, partial [Ignavibacteria bacterium]|nr:VCBS repeat-containing protein [Ignavibacteria bacterium]